MRKLLDSITLPRPKTCDECPFDFDDSDNGPMCDSRKSTWVGDKFLRGLLTPEEALLRKTDCYFIQEDI